MIGKISEKRKDGGSSFFALAKYILHGDDGESRVVYANVRNTFCEFDNNDEWAWQTVASEMNALGDANARCADPVFHFILSFRPEEIPTTAQVDEAVEIALKELNLENCKALYGLQNDNGIHHVHVSVCRIDPETEKAIHPAGGWTKKALGKAARKIEVAQGWEVLRENRFWDVTDDGEIVKKGSLDRRETPSLDTKDFEVHMGEKSAQTIAIEQVAPIIRDARSWQELHEKLNEVGFKFELKGSGAVVVVGDEIVKASNVGRDYSLSKLEKRFGVFVGRDDVLPATENIVKPRKPEPTKQTETSPETLSAWRQYQLYKAGYISTKEERNTLFTRQKSEREELQKLHKAQRDKLFETSWKGRGAELNQERRIIAVRQLQDRLRLKYKHEDERESLEGETTPQQFLSYRKWVAKEDPECITKLRSWRDKPAQEKPLEKPIEPPQTKPLEPSNVVPRIKLPELPQAQPSVIEKEQAIETETQTTSKNMTVGKVRVILEEIRGNIHGDMTHPSWINVKLFVMRTKESPESKPVDAGQAEDILADLKLSKLSAREAAAEKRKRESRGGR